MINIAGVVSISIFYLLILGVGIWAGRKKEEGNDSEEEVMLAGRSIGLFVGIFTMTGKPADILDFYEKCLCFSRSDVGWRWIYQWNGRSDLHIGFGVVSSTVRICIELGVW